MSDNGLVTTVGRQLKARLLRGEPSLVQNNQILGLSWFAVGSGNWADPENPPAESAGATGLATEIARKKLTRSAFIQLDALGTILFNGQTYTEVAGPTPIVAFFADFTEEELSGAAIAEEGLFGGPVVTLSSPFAVVGEVVQPGDLYWIRHRPRYLKGPRDSLSIIAVFEE